MLNRLFESLSRFFSNPKKVMWLTFILGTVFSTISTACITSYSSDASLYIAMAHAFAIGDWSRAFLDNIPPLVPVMSGLVTMLGIPPWDSAMIVGCVFYVVTIFPLYGILSFFIDKKHASWGALFYLLAPKMMRYGMTPLFEGSRMFFFILPVYFLFSFIKERKIYKLALLGMSLAFLALARGEGILSVPVISFALIILCWRDNKYKINFLLIRNLIVYLLVVVCAMIVVLFPRLYQVYQKTGFPATDVRVVELTKSYIAKYEHTNNALIKDNKLNSGNQTISPTKEFSYSTLDSKYITSFKYFNDFIQNIARGSYEIYLILSAIGIILLCRIRKWTMEYSLLLFLAFFNAAMFYFSYAVNYRYFLVNVMLFMPFTLLGYNQLLNLALKYRLQKIFILAVLILLVGQLINGMDNSIDKSKYYTMQTGYYLEEQKNKFEKDANGYPTVFILGTDCGTNLYEDFNIMNPGRSQYFIGSYYDLEQALKGLPSSECLSVATFTSPKINLTPNIILVFDPDELPTEVTFLRSQSNIKEINLSGIKKTLLFKVINGQK